MKRLMISAVLALALGATTAFAAQNKNAPAKKPAAKPTAAAATSNTGAKKPAVHKRRKHAAKTMANANAAGTMSGAAKKPAVKKGNSNK